MPINTVRMKCDSSVQMNQETNEQKLNGDLKLDQVWQIGFAAWIILVNGFFQCGASQFIFTHFQILHSQKYLWFLQLVQNTTRMCIFDV